MPESRDNQPASYSFEELMNEIERMVQALEKGDLSLERTLEIFREGVDAFRQAESILSKAEVQVHDMMKELEVADDTRSENPPDNDPSD
jgi:exodeoxyribonuclease VII small subunit